MKYFAAFKSGGMELENSSDDLQSIKNWIGNLLSEYPSPIYAVIRDEDQDKPIFEEHNENQAIL